MYYRQNSHKVIYSKYRFQPQLCKKKKYRGCYFYKAF